MPAPRHCSRCDFQTADPTVRYCPKCGSPLRAPIEFYDAFVSYRREGGSELAELVRLSLQTQYGLNLFIDVNELKVGAFDEKLLAIIENSPCFVLILSKGSLERCQNDGDWLRREIAHALKYGKTIVPVLAKGVVMPPAEELPEDIRALTSMNGVPYDHQYREAAIAKIGGFIRDGQPPLPVPPAPRPRKGLWRRLAATLLAGGLLAAGYFQWYVPQSAQWKIEAQRKAEAQAAEAERQRAEQERRAAEERAAAEAREKAAKAKQAAEAAARAKAEQELAAEEAARQAVAKGNLVVRSEPLGAEVSVGEGIQGTEPLMLKQLALGKYAVRVRLAGYEEWSGEAEVKADEFAEVSASLQRSAGTLSLGSLPSGVEVELVGRTVPGEPPPGESRKLKTPAKLELPTGEYTVTFRRTGWPEQAQTVAVKRRATATATAEFVPGSLTVSSEPSGAEIVSDGKVIGTTPQTWSDLAPGLFQLELRKSGYKAAPVSGRVEARQTLRLAAKLEKLAAVDAQNPVSLRSAASSDGKTSDQSSFAERWNENSIRQAFSNDAAPKAGGNWTIPGLNLELVPIPAGSFAMGSTNGRSDEKPVTQVELTRPFWLGRTEVTQAQWQVVMGSNPSYFKGANRPVENVSYDDALKFCENLTARERAAGRLLAGYEYTLPTEAQWEYACRAGTTGDYAGNLDSMGWYADNSGGTTHAVGQKQANSWGVYDMHGNVFEWCLGWKGDYAGGTMRDPAGPSSGTHRVDRGGGWNVTAAGCRSACRFGDGPRNLGNFFGFRLALSSVP